MKMNKFFVKICRLCGEIANNLIDLKNNINFSEYTHKIQLYLNLDISTWAEDSAGICFSCSDKLIKWDRFALHVSVVQEFLKSCTKSFSSQVDNVEPTKKFKTAEEGNRLSRTENFRAIRFEDESDDHEKDKFITPKKIRLKISKRNNDEPYVEYLHAEESQRTSRMDSADDLESSLEGNYGRNLASVDCTSVQEENVNQLRKKGKPVGVLGCDLRYLRWECSECEQLTTSWNALTRHCNKEHGKGPRFHCMCGKTLYSRGSVIKHHLKHTVGLQYKCDQCSKSFHWKRLLDAHALSHLPKDEQPWLCCKCCRRFHSQALLKQHEKMHLPPEHKLLFPCELCEKKLCSKSALASHVRSVHLGERPFVCDQCGLSFTSKGILVEHLNVHSDVFNYHCKHCQKSFKTKYRLRVHMETHLETRYACPVCDLSLNTRRTLRMHLLVHEETKHFQCPTCGKGFKRAKDLKNHLNLHTGLKPYTCVFCARTFANGSNCRSHKRRMHPRELKEYEQTQITDGKTDKKRKQVSIVISPVIRHEKPEDPINFKEYATKREEMEMALANTQMISNLTTQYTTLLQPLSSSPSLPALN